MPPHRSGGSWSWYSSKGLSVARERYRESHGGQRAQTAPYGRLLHALRHGVERLAHRRRRRRALVRLAGRGVPRSILVVCVGNICRSPYAAALLRRHLGQFLDSEGQIRSAGLLSPGRRSPVEAIRAAGRRNIDLSAHRSQPITEQLVRHAELIIVMSGEQARVLRNRFPVGRREICHLGDLDPERIDTRDILDPFEREPEVFERSYARIDRCVAEFVRTVAG